MSQKFYSQTTVLTVLLIVVTILFLLFNLIYIGPLATAVFNNNNDHKAHSLATTMVNTFNVEKQQFGNSIKHFMSENDEQHAHDENFPQFIASAFIQAIKYTKERTNDMLLPFIPNIKLTPKESFVYQMIDVPLPLSPNSKLTEKENFAYQLIDSLVMHTQVGACVSNKEQSFKNGTTNQLYGLAGCVASMGRWSAEAKTTPSYGRNKGVAIRAILEPEMCFNGPQCTDRNSIRHVYNVTVINKFISDPKNWESFINIPEKVPHQENDKLISRKEVMKDFEGLIFISKEEYFQLYCLRELFIDSLLKWSKLESGKKSSDELHNLWDALFIGNYFPKRVEVNRLLNNLLKKDCKFHLKQDIEQYSCDHQLSGEFSLDSQVKECIKYLTNTIVNPPLTQQKDSLSYEELLMKKWDVYKKVLNIGSRHNWLPLQPGEWKFYIDFLGNLKPLNQRNN